MPTFWYIYFYSQTYRLYMSALASLFFSHKPQKRSSYFIVKDDFIVNLKKGQPSRSRYIETKQTMGPEVERSTLMVSKKVELLGKLRTRNKNNFFDLDQQIQDNRLSLYRKLSVALRKQRIECKIKLQNPFVKERDSARKSMSNLSQEKTLSRLIFNVQPFWVKRSFTKTSSKFN